MHYSVHYIVCFYFGNRKSAKFNNIVKSDQLFLLKKHLEYLETCGPEIKESTFIVNGDFLETVSEYVTKNEPKNVKLNLKFRENTDFSYGAWNDVIKNSILDGKEFDYHFMMEDDYLPNKPDFYKPFVEKCVGQTAFVCCMLWPKEGSGRHPAISNGLVRNDACKLILEKHSSVFNVNNTPGGDYSVGCSIQRSYHTYFEQEKYILDDLSDQYYFPFHDSQNDGIVDHGNSNGEKLIIPLL
jgi:hypothetical protein